MQFLLERHAIDYRGETITLPMTWYSINSSKQAELVMNSRTNDSGELIDRKTSRSICDAVGERLQQSLRPEALRPSPRLQHLIDELRRRDGERRRPN